MGTRISQLPFLSSINNNHVLGVVDETQNPFVNYRTTIGSIFTNSTFSGIPTNNGHTILDASYINAASGIAGLDLNGDLVGNIALYTNTYAQLGSIVLGSGQPGYTTDTYQFGIGNGLSTFSNLPLISLGLPTPFTLTNGTVGTTNGSNAGGVSGTYTTPFINAQIGSGGNASASGVGGAGGSISANQIQLIAGNGGNASASNGGTGGSITTSVFSVSAGSAGSITGNGGVGGNGTTVQKNVFQFFGGSGGQGNYTNGGNGGSQLINSSFTVLIGAGGTGSSAIGGGTGGNGGQHRGALYSASGNGGNAGTSSGANGGTGGGVTSISFSSIGGNGGNGSTFNGGAGGTAGHIVLTGGNGGNGDGSGIGATGGAGGVLSMNGGNATQTTAGNRAGNITTSGTSTMAGGDIDTSNQTSVNGSTSGSATFSQVFQGGNFGLVIINLSSLNGTASYTFPRAFTNTPFALGPQAATATTISSTSVTITGSTTSGQLVLMGF